MEAAQHGAPSHPVPRVPRLDDRLPDDDPAGQPPEGFPVRIAVTVPQEDKIPEECLPLAFGHGHFESPHGGVLRHLRPRARSGSGSRPRRRRLACAHSSNLVHDPHKDPLDLVLEAHECLFARLERRQTPLVVERVHVRAEIVKDSAGLFGDAARLGEDVVEDVVNVYAMVVERVFVWVSEEGGKR